MAAQEDKIIFAPKSAEMHAWHFTKAVANFKTHEKYNSN